VSFHITAFCVVTQTLKMEAVCSPHTMALVYLQEYKGVSSRKITSETLRAF